MAPRERGSLDDGRMALCCFGSGIQTRRTREHALLRQWRQDRQAGRQGPGPGQGRLGKLCLELDSDETTTSLARSLLGRRCVAVDKASDTSIDKDVAHRPAK